MEIQSPLATLLAPVEIDTFVGEFWNRSPLHIRGDSKKFEWIGLDVEKFFALATSADENAPELKSGRVDDNGHYVEASPPRTEARESFDSGATLCLAGLDRNDGEIRWLSHGLRLALGVDRVIVNSYLSPDESGFGLHFDNHSVLALQLSGRKRWRFSSTPAVAFPPMNVVWSGGEWVGERPSWLEMEEPREALFRTEELQPGDCLYLPPGTWHRARATGVSLHLALGFSRLSPYEVVMGCIESGIARELQRDEVREFLPPATGPGRLVGANSSRGSELLASALDEVRRCLARMTVQDLEQRWFDRVYETTSPLPRRSVPAADLAPTDELVWHPEVPLRFTRVGGANGERAFRLYLPGCVVHLPVEAEAFLERLAATRRFTYAEIYSSAEEANEIYPWEQIAPILEKLVDAGILLSPC